MIPHKQMLTAVSPVCPLTFREFGQSNFGFGNTVRSIRVLIHFSRAQAQIYYEKNTKEDLC